jgi:glyoxylase-like metal-dependent hydrolase (beta-lactamase superfamily II)
LQTFAPVDVSDAVDAEAQPLAAEGIAFFVLRGHTDADLCFQVDDKLFVCDVCMSGIGSVGYSPLWIEDNIALTESRKQLLAIDAEFFTSDTANPSQNAILPSVSKKTREQNALQAV